MDTMQYLEYVKQQTNNDKGTGWLLSHRANEIGIFIPLDFFDIAISLGKIPEC